MGLTPLRFAPRKLVVVLADQLHVQLRKLLGS